MLQHCQWPCNEGPGTHASLWNPQEPPGRHVVLHLDQKTPKVSPKGHGLAMLVGADTDVIVFEPSQVMSSKSCAINVGQLRVDRNSRTIQHIPCFEGNMHSTIRKGSRASKECHKVVHVVTSACINLIHIIPHMSSSLKNQLQLLAIGDK